MHARILVSSATIIVGLVSVGTVSAGAQAVPVFTPQQLLTSVVAGNEPLSISGTGFPKNSALLVTECTKSASTSKIGKIFPWAKECDTKVALALKTNSKGAIAPFVFTIVAGHVGNGTCGTGSTDSLCYLVGVTHNRKDMLQLLPLKFVVLGNISGTLVCSNLAGEMTFTPAVTSSSKGSYVQAVTFKATGCTSGTGAATSRQENGAKIVRPRLWKELLEGLLEKDYNGNSKEGPVAWAIGVVISSACVGPSVGQGGSGDGNSELRVSNFLISATPAGDLEFTFPTSGGTASVHGSFAGADAGATSSATVITNMTLSQVKKAVKSRGGLKSIKIVSGSIALQ